MGHLPGSLEELLGLDSDQVQIQQQDLDHQEPGRSAHFVDQAMGNHLERRVEETGSLEENLLGEGTEGWEVERHS